MDNISSLAKVIGSTFSHIQQQIPAVEKEAMQLIKEKCTDQREIENHLDLLHSLHISGFKVKAHHALIGYLKKLHPEAAQWFKEAFEKETE